MFSLNRSSADAQSLLFFPWISVSSSSRSDQLSQPQGIFRGGPAIALNGLGNALLAHPRPAGHQLQVLYLAGQLPALLVGLCELVVPVIVPDAVGALIRLHALIGVQRQQFNVVVFKLRLRVFQHFKVRSVTPVPPALMG